MIYLTNYAGLKGTADLAKARREALLMEFPAHMIDIAKSLGAEPDVSAQTEIIKSKGAKGFLPLSSGGIFQGLWDFGVLMDAGVEADMRLIPVRMETVEITEFYDINPYRMDSYGAVLYAADSEEAIEIQKALEETGTKVSLIGKLTNKADRIVTYDENVQYLTPKKRNQNEQRKDS